MEMLSAGGRFRFFIPRDAALRCDAGFFGAGEFTATVPWPLAAHGTRTCGEPCFTLGEAQTAFPRGLVGVGVLANSDVKILEAASWEADTSFASGGSVVPRLSFSSPQPIPDVPALSDVRPETYFWLHRNLLSRRCRSQRDAFARQWCHSTNRSLDTRVVGRVHTIRGTRQRTLRAPCLLEWLTKPRKQLMMEPRLTTVSALFFEAARPSVYFPLESRGRLSSVAEATVDVTRNGSRRRSLLDGATPRGGRARWRHVANASNVRWPSTWSRRSSSFVRQPRPDALPRRWWQKNARCRCWGGSGNCRHPLARGVRQSTQSRQGAATDAEGDFQHAAN